MRLTLSLLLVQEAVSVFLRRQTGGEIVESNSSQYPTGNTFQTWYGSHNVGRGIWRWNNALDVYERHLAGYKGSQVALLEVGVDSGGSLEMFQAVLGANCHYYGLDTNPNCKTFDTPSSNIFIGDQGDPGTWSSVFQQVGRLVDVAVDDGGMQPNQMVTTLQQVLPHLQLGGLHSVEHLHGAYANYLVDFMYPAADTLANYGSQIASVHLYPFMMVIQKAPGKMLPLQAHVTVSNFEELLYSIPEYRGGVVNLVNAGWGSFHTAHSLKSFFGKFYSLYQGTLSESPSGCGKSQSGPCKMTVFNSPFQNLIKGIHIFPTMCQVEVHSARPVLEAVRHGSVFVSGR